MSLLRLVSHLIPQTVAGAVAVLGNTLGISFLVWWWPPHWSLQFVFVDTVSGFSLGDATAMQVNTCSPMSGPLLCFIAHVSGLLCSHHFFTPECLLPTLPPIFVFCLLQEQSPTGGGLLVVKYLLPACLLLAYLPRLSVSSSRKPWVS